MSVPEQRTVKVDKDVFTKVLRYLCLTYDYEMPEEARELHGELVAYFCDKTEKRQNRKEYLRNKFGVKRN
jgi:hypothetical protein